MESGRVMRIPVPILWGLAFVTATGSRNGRATNSSFVTILGVVNRGKLSSRSVILRIPCDRRQTVSIPACNSLLLLMDCALTRMRVFSSHLSMPRRGCSTMSRFPGDCSGARLHLTTSFDAERASGSTRAVAALLAAMIVLAASQVTSEELPVISVKSQTFTFAVLGDTHYTPPGYKVTPFIHDIAREIDLQPRSPAFICHTGDVVEGGVYEIHDGKRKFVLASYEEMKSQLGYATHDLEQAFHRPVFIAVGNHDKHDPGYRAYREIALPLISKGLKQPLDRTYYAFRYANACLLFLDFAPRDYDEQARFAGEVLAKAKNDPCVQHIFLFAHFSSMACCTGGLLQSTVYGFTFTVDQNLCSRCFLLRPHAQYARLRAKT